MNLVKKIALLAARSFPFVALWLPVSLSLAPLYAQVERGTIAGTVRDASGGVAVGVDVTVTNVNTGVEYKTKTNDTGEFVAPNLIPGDYSITASLAGFKSLQRKGIVLQVNARVVVDLALEIGEVTQKIEVEASAPMLQSESSAVGTVISRKDVSELPLNGRTVFQLAPLTAGVTNGIQSINANNVDIPDNARSKQGLSVNGQMQAANTYVLDGVYNNQINQGLMAILPPLEAIQEFTVETSNFNPEIGRGGGVVNITLKSGTNGIHGQVFEFLRNSALDARNFFDGSHVPNFVQNQFGVAVGGPIKKNKTFWFFDYQGFRQRKGQTFITTVPGPNIRNGDFRGTGRPIFDPATFNAASNTRQSFPTDMVIDPSRFSPAAVNVLKFIPPSNDPSGTILANGEAYYFSGASRQNDQTSFDVKIDHRFSDKDQFSGRFSYGSSHTVLPGAFSEQPQYAPSVGGALGSGGAGFLNGIVDNPARNLGLQEIHNFSPTTINEFRAAYIRAGSDAVQLGFGHNYADELGIPGVNVTDNNSGFPGISIGGFGLLGESPFFPLIEIENVYQVLDNVTFVRGSHTFKAGVDYRKVQRNFTQILGSPAGSFNFDTSFTADPANPANTGNAFADFLLGVPSSGGLIRNSGLAGLRNTEFGAYWQDTWKVNSKLTLNYGIRYDLFTPQTEEYDRITNFDPVQGILLLPEQGGSNSGFSTRALTQTDKNNFAPRFGFAYKLDDKTVVRSSFGMFFLGQGQAGFQLSLNPPFVGGTNYTNTPVPQIVNRTLDQGIPTTNPFVPIEDPVGSLNAFEANNRTGYSQQWSFGIQRQLTNTLVFETNYVGNNSIHVFDLWDPDQAVLGTGPVEPRRTYYSTIPNVTDIRYQEARGTASYNSWQTTVTKRFARGLSFMGNYTWSHAMAQGAGIFGPGASHQDMRNLDADRGLSATDVRHRFVANWLYELPFGAGKPMASGASGVVQQLIGDWQFGGVAGIQSGSPVNVTGGAGRPNRSCDGNLSRGERTVDRWFDGNCFPIPDPVPDPVNGGVYIPYGNSGGNVIIAPGFVNFDLSLFKSFKVTESKRFEFRSEFFNAFNHTQFGVPQTTANTPLTGRILTARDARQIQFALKFIF
jgi:hypothetical protein